MKRFIVFIKTIILSVLSAAETVLRRALSGAGVHARVLCGVAALAAVTLIVLNVPFSPNVEKAETGLGQPAPYTSLYLNEFASSLAEDDAAPEIPELPEIPEVPPKNILSFTTYTVEKGDTISGIAQKLELNQDSLISCNDIERARSLQIGTMLLVPNMNGIMHKVKAGDNPEELAETYKITVEELFEVNNIEEFAFEAGEKIFIPEAKLSTLELRRVWGELFRYPVRGWITSSYGYRADPFTGKRRFHTGIDIAASYGTPIGAAMEGRVVETGYNNISGNYVVGAHAGGYVTSYAHMSLIRAKKGQWVKDGQRLGDIGSTGYSTGNHLHFSISRWGKSVNPALLLH